MNDKKSCFYTEMWDHKWILQLNFQIYLHVLILSLRLKSSGTRYQTLAKLRPFHLPLKEYLWDRRWIAPLSAFFPKHADFFTECISNHETTQSSKFQSDPSPTCNCFTIDVWNINCWLSTVYFLHMYFLFFLFFVSHFTQGLQCFDMWYFGNRFVLGTIFI